PLTSVWTVLIGPVLITYTLPRKKKSLTSKTHQTEHVQTFPQGSVLSGDRLGTVEGEDQRTQDQTAFLHNVEDKPLKFHSAYNKHASLHIQTDFTVVGLVTF
ncbi:unnamed protein product, partial [Staurois parvus]